jgi:hypothetical protein
MTNQPEHCKINVDLNLMLGLVQQSALSNLSALGTYRNQLTVCSCLSCKVVDWNRIWVHYYAVSATHDHPTHYHKSYCLRVLLLSGKALFVSEF